MPRGLPMTPAVGHRGKAPLPKCGLPHPESSVTTSSGVSEPGTPPVPGIDPRAGVTASSLGTTVMVAVQEASGKGQRRGGRLCEPLGEAGGRQSE